MPFLQLFYSHTKIASQCFIFLTHRYFKRHNPILRKHAVDLTRSCFVDMSYAPPFTHEKTTKTESKLLYFYTL